MFNKKFVYTLTGAVSGGLVEGLGVTDIVLKQIPGTLQAVEWRDANGVWIWGFGTGDLIDIILGLGIKYYAYKKGKPNLDDFANGWLAGVIGTKLGELYLYVNSQYISKVTPAKISTGSPSTLTRSKYVITA